MDILGHGIDIVEVERVRQLLARPDDHLLTRCFTTEEQAAGSAKSDPPQYFAGRLAAKEAVLKALGTGWVNGIAFTDIEIRQLASGVPFPVLQGRCGDLAAVRGIEAWWLSISHTNTYAVASAIAVGKVGLAEPAGA